MSSSGFLEIEGGVQPALPTAGRGRLWFNSSTNEWFVVFSNGNNKQITLPINALNDQVLTWNGSAWVASDPNVNRRRIFSVYDDFISQNGNALVNFRTSISGGGVVVNDYGPFANLGNRVGIVRLAGGTANGNRSALDSQGVGVLIFDDGITTYRASVFLSSGSLTPGNFKVGMWGLGLNGAQTVLNFARGCYFKIRPQTNGSNIIAVCSESSTHTEVNMGNISETTWYLCEIIINSTGPSAVFNVYQDGSTTALYSTTITSNIPLGVNNLVEPILYFSTQGGGGSAAFLYCDYVELIKVFDNIR